MTWRAIQYLRGPLPATSSNALLPSFIYLKQHEHPMTWRATSGRPYTRVLREVGVGDAAQMVLLVREHVSCSRLLPGPPAPVFSD